MEPAVFIRREVWRWVPGYEGRYIVSNMGAVRSFHKVSQGYISMLRKGERRGTCNL